MDSPSWFYRYKVMDKTYMEPKPRSDKGVPRKITHDELLEAIEKNQAKDLRQKVSQNTSLRACIQDGYFESTQLAYTTFTRLVDQYELLNADTETNNKTRLAFAKPHANDMWQADTLFGPYVKNGKAHTQTKLIAFIDDCSRTLDRLSLKKTHPP